MPFAKTKSKGHAAFALQLMPIVRRQQIAHREALHRGVARLSYYRRVALVLKPYGFPRIL
jgi:hypothetical protein